MTNPARSFQDFGVDDAIAAALADAGISTPFPIQELTLPLALSGADVIGQARTGTGKTLAFGIPLLQRVDPDAGFVQALVVVPTRELCLQVTGDLNQAGVRRGVDVVAVYGGRAIEPQEDAIAGGAAVVVGTPGRLLDLVRRRSLDLSRVTGLVLDEADEMLDLGFLPDVEQLIQATAPQRQTLLFSATMPSQVVALARRYMEKPTFLRADFEQVQVAPETTQYFFSCHRMDKPAVLARILQAPSLEKCVVFSRTKRMCDILAEELRGRGVNAAPIHSDLRQEARERAMERFRAGTTKVLVATEVAARGLDIAEVTHVVNYDCPDDEKMYLHRIGRTGRAGAAGVAITLAVWNELARLEMIKKALDITDETHEVFSTSPLLDEIFSLPPRASRHPVREQDDEAPAARDERPAEATAEVEGGRSRRRGGRRRGRRAGGDRSEPLTVPASPVTPAEAATPDAAVGVEARSDLDHRPQPEIEAETARPEPQPADGDGEAGRRVRVRRRAGREDRRPIPSGEGDWELEQAPVAVDLTLAAQPAAETPQPAAETPQPAAEGPRPAAEGREAGPQPGEARTRRRTRARRGTGRAGGEAAAVPPPASDGAPAPGSEAVRDGARPRRDRRGDDAGRSESRRDRQRAAAPAGREGRARGGRRASTRGDGRQNRGSRGTAPAPASAPGDPATARGPGRPMLSRPMLIDHLP